MKRWLWICPLLLSIGCKKIEIRTQVHEDGSLERIVTVDSSAVNWCAYPVPRGGDWTVEFNEDESGDTVYVARRLFRDAAELNGEFDRSAEDSLRINSRVELDVKFRWFTTRLIYRERFMLFSPFRHFLLDSVMTAEEREKYMTGAEDSTLEEKLQSWDSRVIPEQLYRILLGAAYRLRDPGLPVELIRQRKQELFEAIGEMDLEESADAYLAALLSACEKALETTAIRRLEDDIAPFAESLAAYFHMAEKMIGEEYENTVVMPGLILDTNAPELEGNRVTWTFDADDFHYRDREMWVESRIVNRTMIAITAFVLLLLMAALIAGALTARRR